jgi:DNA-binding LytR/AlgR family response regulator
MTFGEIVSKLPSSQFVRVHQSYIVSVLSIDKIENNHILIDNSKIPISSRYRDLLFKQLNLD